MLLLALTPSVVQAFRTWNLGNVSAQKDWGKFMPWRAPGRAPVTSPCGIQSGYGPGQGLFPCALYKTKAACKTTPSSGGTGGEPDCAWNATTSKCGQPEGAPPFRPFCEDYPSHCAKKPQGTPGTALPPTVPTAWKAGGVVNVTWQLQVNHGGGFQYRLCAKGAKGGLTEQCFQRTPLAFATDTTVVRWKNGTEIRIAARDVDVGTVPSGSAWRRNPIPACSCDSGVRCNFLNATVPVNTTWDAMYGDAVDPTAPPSSDPTRHGWGCPTGLQFPAPAPGLYGYYAPNSNISNFEMVDEVLVPAVPAGEYAMSWRWDCEQTPQIWASCSDLVITA